MEQKIFIKNQFSVVAAILTALLLKIFIDATGYGMLTLKILLVLLLSICISGSLIYAWRGNINTNHEDFEERKHKINTKLSIVFILIGVYFPIMTDGFFFHDDYINFLGFENNFFQFSISQARPITGMFTDIMSFVTVENSNLLRIISVICVCIYALMLYELILSITKNNFKAFVISIASSIIMPILNICSYGSMFIYILPFIFSTISVIYFVKGFEIFDKRKKIKYLIYSAILIITANLTYQTTTTISFFVIFIFIFYERDKKIKNYISYIFYILHFVICTGLYYLFSKLLSYIYNIDMMGRASLVSNLNELIEKIIWFLKIVLPENIKQLISSQISFKLFMEKGQYYILNFNNKNIGNILSTIVILLIIYSIYINAIKQKNFIKMILILLTIPLSYYCFLILLENSYTSYYSAALCSIFTFLFLEGLINIVQFKNNTKKIIGYIFILIITLNSNFYLRDFWVEHNSLGYKYIKIELQNNYKPSKKIHIYGSIIKGQADIYSINATKMALKELGMYDENISITTSSDENLIEVITKEKYLKMIDSISDEEKKFINSIYSIDENFGILTVDYNKLNTKNIEKLRGIFEKSNLIPKESEDIVFINLKNMN